MYDFYISYKLKFRFSEFELTKTNIYGNIRCIRLVPTAVPKDCSGFYGEFPQINSSTRSYVPVFLRTKRIINMKKIYSDRELHIPGIV